MSDEMAQAHARDYADERAFRDTARAITKVLDDHADHISDTLYGNLVEARSALVAKADHIVAVWD